MTASNFTSYLERNREFAATDAKDNVPEIPFIPQGITIVRPLTGADPAACAP